MRCRLSSANDPHAIRFILVRIDVNDDHNNDWTDGTDGMPSLLSIFDPIRNDHMQWIIPNALSKFESDTVFRQISSGLLRIPFEAHISSMYVQ